MIGLLYKNFKQNSFPLLVAFCISAVFLISIVVAVKSISPSDDIYIVIGFVWGGLVYIFLSAAQSGIIESGEKKKWAYFVKSTPETEKGEIAARYLLVFFTSIGMFFWLTLLNSILSDIFDDVPVFTSPLIYISMLQLLIKSVQFPMTMRFGGKMGSHVRVGFILAASIIFAIIALYYKGFSMDGIYKVFLNFFDGLAETSENDSISDNFLVLYSTANIITIISLVMYYLSYKLSCKLYLKGVEANYAR